MKPRFLASTVVFLVLASCAAQETNFITSLSPKLRDLLASNSAALTLLTEAFSSAGRTNTVQVTYFYTEDDSQWRARHFYPHIPGGADVVLLIRENQKPLDEFICIYFELLNSKNQSRFEALFEKARSGTVEKREFVRALDLIEFESTLNVKAVLQAVGITKKEKAQSHYYSRFVNCPVGYQDFQAYRKKLDPKTDYARDYEEAYDALRRER